MPVLLFSDIIVEIVFFLFRRIESFNLLILIIMFIMFAIGFYMPHIEPYGWPMGADIGFVAAGFMISGYFIRSFLDSNWGIKRGTKFIGISLMIICCLFVIVQKIFPIQSVSMYKGSYGSVHAFLINAMLQSLIVIYFSVLIKKISFCISHVMSFVGKNTMCVLVIHKPIVKYFSAIASNKGYSMESLGITIIIALVGMIISLAIGKIIDIILPEILGKSR